MEGIFREIDTIGFFLADQLTFLQETF